MRFSTRAWLGALVTVALIVRLAVAAVMGLNEPPQLNVDAHEYDTYAWNLAEGRGYRGSSPGVTDPDHVTAHRMPGTPLFWAPLFYVFGHRYDVVRVAQCLLGALSVLFLYEIGRRCFDERIAIAASAVYTIWPTSLVYAVELQSEALYTAVFLAYVLLSLRFASRPSALSALGAGLLLGFCVLTRANAVFMVALAMVWATWQFRRQRRALMMALGIPLVALAVLVPWTVRNYVQLHAFLPFGTGGGDVLLGSNNRVVAADPLYYGYWVSPMSALPEYRDQLIAVNDEVQRDRLQVHLALQWLREHPDRWWYLLQSRFRRSLTPFVRASSSTAHRIGMLASWGWVLPLAFLAFVPTAIHFLRLGHAGWILHLGVIHFGLTALVFWGSSRFRYPVEGLCILLACAGVAWILGRVRNTRAPSES